jgi:hypothetical protein
MATTLPIWFGSIGLTPDVTSGKITLADRSTLIDVYNGPYVACVAGIVARGVFGTGQRLGFVCTSSIAEQVDRGNKGRLTINWEAGGPFATLPLPVDEFDYQPQEIYPRIERSPIFTGITTDTLALAYATVEAPTALARATAINYVNTLADLTQRALGQKLVSKLLKGEQTFYRAYARYIHTSYSYLQPALNLGGIISSPTGPLAAQLSTAQCLRLADALQPAGVNGSMYKIMKTWLCAPASDGYWDTDLNG